MVCKKGLEGGSACFVGLKVRKRVRGFDDGLGRALTRVGGLEMEKKVWGVM